MIALLSGPLSHVDAVEPRQRRPSDTNATAHSLTEKYTSGLKRTLPSQRFRSVPRQERTITSSPKRREPLGLFWTKRPTNDPVDPTKHGPVDGERPQTPKMQQGDVHPKH